MNTTGNFKLLGIVDCVIHIIVLTGRKVRTYRHIPPPFFSYHRLTPGVACRKSKKSFIDLNFIPLFVNSKIATLLRSMREPVVEYFSKKIA